MMLSQILYAGPDRLRLAGERQSYAEYNSGETEIDNLRYDFSREQHASSEASAS